MEGKPSPCPTKSDMTVQTGTHVVVELLGSHGESERLEFIIVPDKIADFPRGFLGEGTHLAQAILKKPAGAVVAYRTEDIHQVRILSVTATTSLPDEGLARQRADALRKARDQIERTNAIIFASSFSGKWGDYDPGGIDHWDENGEEDRDS